MIHWAKRRINSFIGVSTKQNSWEKIFNAMGDWVSLIDLDARIIQTNPAFDRHFGLEKDESIGTICCQILHGRDAPVDGCPLCRMCETRNRACNEEQVIDGRWVMVSVDPVFDRSGQMVSAVHISRDVTSEVDLRIEREALVTDLQKSVTHFKPLKSLLPICSNCKRIRDHSGSWNVLEAYFKKHSGLRFSHGLCPDCLEDLYGDSDWYKAMKKRQRQVPGGLEPAGQGQAPAGRGPPPVDT